MSEPTATIQLKQEYKKPREVSVGNKTVKAAPGENIKVPLTDLEMWLKTGRFESVEIPEVEADASDLPQGIPGRKALVKVEGLTLEKLNAMNKGELEAIPNIGRNLADQILQYFDKNGGSN
jgi:hypothetical protein